MPMAEVASSKTERERIIIYGASIYSIQPKKCFEKSCVSLGKGQMYKRPQLRKVFYGPFLPLEFPKSEPKPEPKIWSFKFKPIKYLDSYLVAMKTNGASDEELAAVKERHTVVSTPPVVKETGWVCPVKYLDQVLVNLSVKNGKVKLGLNIPFDESIKYYKAGKIPPIETRIRCLKRAGAPRSILIKMLKDHEEYFTKKNLDKEQVKLDKVFMKFNVKPTQKILKPVKKKIS